MAVIIDAEDRIINGGSKLHAGNDRVCDKDQLPALQVGESHIEVDRSHDRYHCGDRDDRGTEGDCNDQENAYDRHVVDPGVVIVQDILHIHGGRGIAGNISILTIVFPDDGFYFQGIPIARLALRLGPDVDQEPCKPILMKHFSETSRQDILIHTFGKIGRHSHDLTDIGSFFKLVHQFLFLYAVFIGKYRHDQV